MSNRSDWVASALGRELSEVERVLVEIVCDAARCGPYDLSGWDTRLRPCGYGARFSISHRDLATYDSDGLTRLVFSAHDHCARVAIGSAGFGGIEIKVWLRGERNSASFWGRHPTLETAVAAWRERRSDEAPNGHKPSDLEVTNG